MKALLRCAAILFALLIIGAGAAFVRGSLETFPTQEQQDEVKLVYGMTFVAFALIELGALLWLRKLSRQGSQT
jgi:hypothetical protein